MLIFGAEGDADGLLLRAVLEIVQLVRGALGVPAVTSAGLVDHRLKDKSTDFPFVVWRKLSVHFQSNSRVQCQNGGTPHSSGCSCRSGYQGTCCEGGNSLCTDVPRQTDVCTQAKEVRGKVG